MPNQNTISNTYASPIPSLEWKITNICNYRCPYCFSATDNRVQCVHSSKQTMGAINDLLSELPGSWLVKLIGGEAMLHPRFFDICQMIVKHGHRLCLTTNFSLPIRDFERLSSICGPSLDYITASLHLSQVADIDAFIHKAREFWLLKNPHTGFTVTCVMTTDNFEELKDIFEKFEISDIHFKFQVIREKGKYLHYPPEIESYLSGKLIKNTNTLRARQVFGTLCHAGSLFFRLDVNGDAFRCYSPQPGVFLGNLLSGRFNLFDRAEPCLARRCTCTVPANRNMILFGTSASPKAVSEFLIKRAPYSLYWFIRTLSHKVRIGLDKDKHLP